MSKIAFLFPGQGSQYVGMGKEFLESDKDFETKFFSADKILGRKLSDIILNGPIEELTLTNNAQPALYLTAALIMDKLAKAGIKADVVAGHSLGEYTALYAAEVLSFEDGLKAVQSRGNIMAKAVPAGKGTMAAIIGLNQKQIQEELDKVQGAVNIANINSLEQIVISGEKQSVLDAMELLTTKGASRVIELTVSGPFHSTLMQPAGLELGKELDKLTFNTPNKKFIANVTANYASSVSEIKDLLVKQVSGSVRWVETIQKMAADGVDVFIEVGPGKVLAGLNRRINRDLKTYNVEDEKSLLKVIEELKK